LKNVKNVEFSKTCFSQVKWWGYDLFSVTMGLEWLWKVYMSLNLILLWKWLSFWKRGKWDEFREFLELNGIKLWCGFVWTTVMICDIWTCFVDVFEHECLILCELFGKRWFLWKWTDFVKMSSLDRITCKWF
jgi:hypothetical protein